MSTISNMSVAGSGGGGGGGAVTIADGADVAEGATTDAAVQGDTAGTVEAKLRGLNKLAGTSADTAASTSIFGKLIAIADGIPASLGQKVMAQSTPVAIASDQSAVPISNAGIPASLGQKVMAQSTPVVIASDQSAISVSNTGHGVIVGQTFARPATTPTYAANQWLSSGAYFTVANAVRAGVLSGILTSIMIIDQNNAATPLVPELYLFTSAPAGAFTDNTNYNLSNADALKLVPGAPIQVPFSRLTNPGAAAAGQRVYYATNLAIELALTSTTLYAVIGCLNAYTAISAESFSVYFGIDQD